MLIIYFLLLYTCVQVEKIQAEDQCNGNGNNKYSECPNIKLSHKEMFEKGHMKPFGSHRPSIKIEELKYMISPEDFYMNFVAKHVPVVLKGVTKHWAAYNLWTDEYLSEKYGNVEVKMETKDDDKVNIPKSKLFKDFLKVYKDANLYMVDEVLPDMRKDITMPLCLRCEEINRFFFVSYYWHSYGNTMSTIHIDTDENLLCVIKGHKKVLMVSPVFSRDLYADDTRQNGVLDVNASAIDFEKYPNMINVSYHEAQVEEGDCVYIPQMWWHQVVSRKERQQAVALWWKSKPFWKKVKNKHAPGSSIFPKEKRRKHSYADALIDYEHWVKNVSNSLERVRCEEQNHVKMSDYTWESDYDPSIATLGDGGDVEEDVFEKNRLLTPHEIIEKSIALMNEKGIEGNTCGFDRENEKSPCYMPRKDYLPFVRYVMDYCQEFEDRGCVINKPQILNKMMKTEFQEMAFEIESEYEKKYSR